MKDTVTLKAEVLNELDRERETEAKRKIRYILVKIRDMQDERNKLSEQIEKEKKKLNDFTYEEFKVDKEEEEEEEEEE